MSGTPTTSPAPEAATSAAPAPQAPQAPQAQAQASSPGMLNLSPRTESAIGLLFAATLCLCIAGTWFVLCARVWQDGNAPLTLQISQLMLNTVPYMVAALVGGLLGRSVLTTILSAIQARIAGPTGPVAPTGGTQP